MPFLELRPPVMRQQGAARHWTITMFPITRGLSSKTSNQDVTKSVGCASCVRAWVTQLCPLLAAQRPRPDMLFPLVYTTYLEYFHLSGVLANVVPGHPHQMRHGAASMDALAGAQDLSLLERGNWKSIKSVQRYRQPGPYMRRLQKLSTAQMSLAAEAPSQIMIMIRKIMIRKIMR